MKKILLLAITVLLVSCTSQKNIDTETTTVYYLIRHAEKDRSNASNKNPYLNEMGTQRAQNWAKILQDIPFDAVYATQFNRTQQTATPTAEKNGLEILTYNPFNLDLEKFRNETTGKTVLIVGHSNTTPDFVNKLIASETYKPMADNDNGKLFIVTISGTSKSVQVLNVN